MSDQSQSSAKAAGDFSRQLLAGEFQVLWEHPICDIGTSPGQIATENQQFLQALTEHSQLINGVVISDREDGNPQEYEERWLEELSQGYHGSIIVTVAGKGRTQENLSQHMQTLLQGGRYAILGVTGGPLHQSLRDSKEDGDRVSFMDGVDIIAQGTHAGGNCGGAFNPFQYRRDMQSLQYAKMRQKLSAGAAWLLLQCGWDMAKLLELQWYLTANDLRVPCVARLCWIDEKTLEHPERHLPTGVLVPELMLREMRQDLKRGEGAFVDGQIHRLAMQLLGIKRTGYSGVLLHDFPNMHLAQRLLTLTEQYAKQYPDYPTWRRAWDDEFTDLMRPPVVTPEYLYHGLPASRNLVPEAQEASPARHRTQLPRPPFTKRLAPWVLSRLARPGAPTWLAKLFCKINGVDYPQLPTLQRCLWVNNHSCPRALTAGVCGNANADGECDLAPNRPCFFRQVLAYAAATGRLPELESYHPVEATHKESTGSSSAQNKGADGI